MSPIVSLYSHQHANISALLPYSSQLQSRSDTCLPAAYPSAARLIPPRIPASILRMHSVELEITQGVYMCTREDCCITIRVYVYNRYSGKIPQAFSSVQRRPSALYWRQPTPLPSLAGLGRGCEPPKGLNFSRLCDDLPQMVFANAINPLRPLNLPPSVAP